MTRVQKLKQILKQNIIIKILLYIAALVEPVVCVCMFSSISSPDSIFPVNPYYVLWVSFYACVILWWISNEGTTQWMISCLLSFVNALIILMFVFVALIGGAFDLSMLVIITIFPFAFPLALWTKNSLLVLIGCILVTVITGCWIHQKKSCEF